MVSSSTLPTDTLAAPTLSSSSAPSGPATAITPTNLAEAWELWLTLPRAGGEDTNAGRSHSDLLNHRRAVDLFALGSRGSDDLTQVPLADLALEVELVREKLLEGLKLQLAQTKRSEPSAKTISNLLSNLTRFRSDLKEVLSLPELAPKTGYQLRLMLPCRKRQERLSYDAWPQTLLDDWGAYKAYRTEPFYAGVGKEYRGKALREVSVNAHKVRIGQLVRYCLLVEEIQDLNFEHLVDIERIHRFRAWYFKAISEGGYDSFKQTCIAVALFAKYFCATGRAFTQFTPDTRAASAPWTILYNLGRTTKAEGASEGKLIKTTRITHMMPHDLLALADRAWSGQPRRRSNSGVHAFTIFNRKRAAVFFALAPFMPVRRRNWINMRWGKNLFRQRDGTWVVRFKGEELKVGQRGGAVNVYEHELPALACSWIEKWRAFLKDEIGPDFETEAPYVLPSRMLKRKADGSHGWTRCNYGTLPKSIGDTCLELRGHDFPMHQIRHIVATNLVNNSASLQDAQLAADLLGDTLDTVLSSYYRPNHEALRRSYFDRLQQEVGYKG